MEKLTHNLSYLMIYCEADTVDYTIDSVELRINDRRYKESCEMCWFIGGLEWVVINLYFFMIRHVCHWFFL